ncbi:hypothetical protein C8Q79DRAFT_988623 [Trametes meyenii]|nr:hypothetical protein C8Q79DRAFT_988623 [Trametes meyenii]
MGRPNVTATPRMLCNCSDLAIHRLTAQDFRSPMFLQNHLRLQSCNPNHCHIPI